MIVKVLGLVFLFIIRIRFPKRKSIADIIRIRHKEYANLKRTTINYGKVIWI